MADKSLKQISKDIEEGQYFDNAFNWHCEKFLKVYLERNILLVIFVLLVICVTILFFQIKAWFPLRVNAPVVIETSIDSDFYLTMDKMSHRYKNPDYAILSYLLRNFVRLMEEYKKGDLDPLKIDGRIRKISNNTTKEIAKVFADNFSQNNKKNPVYRFGKSGTRRVEFGPITLLGIDESFLNQVKSFGKKVFKLPSEAIVSFTTIEKNFLGDVTKEKWTVRVNFLFSGVLLEDNGGKRKMSIPEFTITNYRVTKIGK